MPTIKQDAVTAQCSTNGLSLTPTSSKAAGFAAFLGVNNHLSTNSKIKLQIDISKLQNGSAGIVTRTDNKDAAGYAFNIQSNGFWDVVRYSVQSNGQILDSGALDPHAIHTMEVQTSGAALSLSLDGTLVSSLHDTTYKTTDHILLSVTKNDGSNNTAIFSNFVVTPLP